VEHAGEQHQAVAAEAFAPREVELPAGRAIEAGRFRVIDRVGMDNIPPPEWILDDAVILDGYGILFAPFSSYKSFIALDMALAVATGAACMSPTNAWSGRSAYPGPVLFIAGEGRAGITKRVRAWEITHLAGERVENIYLADPVPLIAEDPQPFIEAALKASPDGYRLVVLDTISRAMQGMDENSQKDASAFTKLAERLRRDLGCTVLAVHHTGHTH
ncbi:MAG: AAA family ATPase, partial [Rhodospirillaceae bacterium]